MANDEWRADPGRSLHPHSSIPNPQPALALCGVAVEPAHGHYGSGWPTNQANGYSGCVRPVPPPSYPLRPCPSPHLGKSNGWQININAHYQSIESKELMDKTLPEMILETIPNQQRANELMARLFEMARPETVFSPPVSQGDYTVITASEMTMGLGFGYGGGGGSNEQPSVAEGQPPAANIGSGGGGGGGGTVMSRPVAVIEIGPHGVRVEPIMDPTKIALAFFTTLVTMFMFLRQLKR